MPRGTASCALGALLDFKSCVLDQQIESPLGEHCPKHCLYPRPIPVHLLQDHDLALLLLFGSTHLVQDQELLVVLITRFGVLHQVVCGILTHSNQIAGLMETL